MHWGAASAAQQGAAGTPCIFHFSAPTHSLIQPAASAAR
jgi:hypothetical protein